MGDGTSNGNTGACGEALDDADRSVGGVAGMNGPLNQ
jgi:hypothetical protein